MSRRHGKNTGSSRRIGRAEGGLHGHLRSQRERKMVVVVFAEGDLRWGDHQACRSQQLAGAGPGRAWAELRHHATGTLGRARMLGGGPVQVWDEGLRGWGTLGPGVQASCALPGITGVSP